MSLPAGAVEVVATSIAHIAYRHGVFISPYEDREDLISTMVAYVQNKTEGAILLDYPARGVRLRLTNGNGVIDSVEVIPLENPRPSIDFIALESDLNAAISV